MIIAENYQTCAQIIVRDPLSVDHQSSEMDLFNDFPSLIWRSGIDGRYFYFNNTWLQFTGRTLNEEIGEGWMAGIHPDDSENFLQSYLSAFLHREPFKIEFRLRRYDGTYRWINENGRPILDQGEFKGYIGSGYDVTEQKQHEMVLQESEERYRKLAEGEQHRVQRLDALHQIDLAITKNKDLSVILKVVIEQTIKQLKVDAVIIFLFQPKRNRLEHAASLGFRNPTVRWVKVTPGEQIAGKVAQEKAFINLSERPDLKESFLKNPLVDGEDFIDSCAAPLVIDNEIRGVMQVLHRSPLNPELDWLEFFQSLATQTSIAIDDTNLFEKLDSAHQELVEAYDQTIEGWSRALDLRDKETEGHTRRVAKMTVDIAREIGMSGEQLIHARRGALLHDIGKMGVPDKVLLKKGPLDEQEWQIMRRHPLFALDMLFPIIYLRNSLEIPYYHHEKWDGTGYPEGLKGEEIPLFARIFAIVDVWDALTSDRPYRKAWSREMALDYIQSEVGKHFDPHVVEVFLKYVHTTASE